MGVIAQMSLNNLFIASDLDGTLIPHKAPINKRDIEAIVRFKEKGGRITFCTGRAPAFCEEYAKIFQIDEPIICCNGGVIYDMSTKEVINPQYLPIIYKQVLKTLSEVSPELGVEAVELDNVIITTDSHYFDRHRQILGENCKVTTFDKLPDKCFKAILVGDAQYVDKVLEFVKDYSVEGITFVASAPTCFEIIPTGVTKGSTLKEYARIYDIEQEHIMSIGDYYNDVEMIKFASIGATFETSPDDIKEIADYIAPPCEQAGFSSFIEHIEATFG